jgi:hypothetical protein
VSSRYFEVMGIRLFDGRVFSVRDRFGSEPVAVVSATLAARLWPHTRAVGQSLTIHPDGDGPILSATVIGIVSDTRQSHTDTDQLDVYLPLSQRASRFAFLYLRRPQAPSWEGDVRSAIARVNPEVAIGTPRRLGDGIDQERSRGRALAFLLTIFAVFASVLALVGMHGVIAYTVRQRQREIAVRIALGADSRSVMGMFVRHGAGVLVVGLLAGTGGAMGLGRVLQSQLYGVEAGDPRVLAAALVAFGMSAMAAVLWPARRAASVDPVEVLKTE